MMSALIKYFVKNGDQFVSELFTPYVWGELGFDSFLKKTMTRKSYGDVKLILIRLYVEGKFEIGIPDTIQVGRYSSKTQDISVDVPVRREDFHDKTDHERKQFILSSTEKAIMLVYERTAKKKLDLDLPAILADIHLAAKFYIPSTT